MNRSTRPFAVLGATFLTLALTQCGTATSSTVAPPAATATPGGATSTPAAATSPAETLTLSGDADGVSVTHLSDINFSDPPKDVVLDISGASAALQNQIRSADVVALYCARNEEGGASGWGDHEAGSNGVPFGPGIKHVYASGLLGVDAWNGVTEEMVASQAKGATTCYVETINNDDSVGSQIVATVPMHS